MPSIKTGDLKENDFKERGKPGEKKKVVQTRALSNADISKARDQGKVKENGKEQPETE